MRHTPTPVKLTLGFDSNGDSASEKKTISSHLLRSLARGTMEGQADHGLAPEDFRHSGLKLEWGHEHSPDAFEVFAIAASRDGTKIVQREYAIARVRD